MKIMSKKKKAVDLIPLLIAIVGILFIAIAIIGILFIVLESPVGQESSVVVPTPGDPVDPQPDEVVTLPTPDLDGTAANSVSPIPYSWSELKALAQANLSADELRDTYGVEVGDYKEVDYVKYVLVDLGLDEGDYDGFVFMYKTGVSLQMNSRCTNTGGYAATDIMKDYLNDLYKVLATHNNELYKAIKKVNVVCNDDSKAYDAGTYTHTVNDVGMFLASAKEVGFNVSEWKNPNGYLAEGECFDLFNTNDSSRTDFMSTVDIPLSWWLRSASAQTRGYFACVSTWYITPFNGADRYNSVVPVFVIG